LWEQALAVIVFEVMC